MVGWHLSEREFEQTLGEVEDREACSMTVLGAAESDTTYPLNKNNLHNPLDFLNTFNLTYS